jgi:hypothetical protein
VDILFSIKCAFFALNVHHHNWQTNNLVNKKLDSGTLNYDLLRSHFCMIKMRHNQVTQSVRLWQGKIPRGPCLTHRHRFFSASASLQQKCHSTKKNNNCKKSSDPSHLIPKTQQQLRSIQDPDFWTCKSTWRRARINTLRCLIGCTIGDFSALWILQTFYPGLGMGVIMGASSNSTPLLQARTHTLTPWVGEQWHQE